MNKRQQLLQNLTGKGKYKYSRYGCSPIRYAGGKSRAVGHILEHLPDDVEILVSPFIGGGSVEIACAKELGIKVHGYDIFEILVKYWQQQIKYPEGLANAIKCCAWNGAPTKENYQEVKQILKDYWEWRIKLNDLNVAAYYWFNHNLSYGPGFLGWVSKIYQDEGRFNRMVERVKNFDCPNLTVNFSVFEDTLTIHENDFLYCDPPYYLEGDSKMFRGIYPQRNFPIHHEGFDHELLRDILHEHKERFILSYNDCEVIREWYKDFEIHEVSWQYTLGQGETRIGKNRIANDTLHNVKKSHELLIVKK